MRFGIVLAVLLVGVLYWVMQAGEGPRPSNDRARASNADRAKVAAALDREFLKKFDDAPLEETTEQRETMVPLFGFVSDERGVAIAEAIVLLGDQVAVTDVDGRFRLEVSSRIARERATIRHPHYRKQRRTLAQGALTNITLRAGLSVAGVVRFAGGAPAAGILVSCRRNSARTDRDGRFRIGGLHAGEDAIVECVAAGTEVFTSPGDENIEFLLQSSTILLEAVDEDGEPVRGAKYRVDYGETSVSGGLPWDTSVALNVAIGKPFRVVVIHDDYLPARIDVQPLSDKAVQDRLTISLERAKLYSVPIHVALPKRLKEFFLPIVHVDHLDEDGALLLRRIVRLRNGRALVKGLPPGDVRLRVAPRYAPLLSVTKRAVASEGDQNPIQFDLPDGNRLEVLWPWSPKTAGSLELRHVGSKEFACEFQSPLGLKSWYSTTWVPAGSYEVRLNRNGSIVRRSVVTISAAGAMPTVDWRKKLR